MSNYNTTLQSNNTDLLAILNTINELPEDIQKELKKGKKADTMGQVYGFLENYSS